MSKTIIISRGKGTNLPRQNIQRHNPHDPFRYGAWCKVLKRYSIDHTVDVETAEGFRVTRVPVTSREWVTLDDPILGARNLPPEGAIVFLFMPTGGIDNAFIFGSCFLPSYDKHKEEFLIEGKEDEELAKHEGNWKRIFDKITGDCEIVGTNNDDETTLTITVKKSEKSVHIIDWNENDILINEDGVIFTDTKKNTTTWNDSGIYMEDKNGNKSTWNDAGIEIQDKNGNKVTKNDSGIVIQDLNGNKITKDSNGIKMEDKNGNKSTMNGSGMKAEDKNGNIVNMAAAGTTITATKAKITGGVLEVNGTAAPSGSGPFCAVPVCPFGMPHIGPLVSGT
jgi:hypothetical protein